MFEERADSLMILPRWGMQIYFEVPFNVIDPKDGSVKNAIVLHSPLGEISRTYPKVVLVSCNSPAKAIHVFGGSAGWGYPDLPDKTVSVIVRLHYADGNIEIYPLINGVQICNWSAKHDVPGSKMAVKCTRNADAQVRYFALYPKRPTTPINEIEFIKGKDNTAPVFFAVTLEKPS